MQGEVVHIMLMTMVTAIAVGIVLIAIGRRADLPVIVLLLAGGVGLGPQGAGLVQPDSLGNGLSVIVAFAIGLILFEGGLTLDLSGYRSAPVAIRRLLTVGVLVTWAVTAAALRVIMGIPVGYAIIAASLVIVTGPTVIGPLLRRVRITDRLHSVLHWEAVLIDPIGVFIAILCFEWVATDAGSSALVQFGYRFVAGLGLGLGGGLLIYESLRRELIPSELLDVVTLGLAIMLFGVTEAIVSEAGLLSMAVAGFVVGIKHPPQLEQLKAFKAQITDLAIGTLFLLLAARLELSQFAAFGPEGFAVVAIVIFLVRPLSVLLSTVGLDFSLRERAFLGWIAPRGIVAASMASLIALSLESGGGSVANARLVETFTYSVIIATIVLQGLSARPLARLLGLVRPAPTGWIIVGAHSFGRAVAAFLRDQAGVPATLIDTSSRMARAARNDGLGVIHADARNVSLYESHDDLHAAGNLLAITDNEAMNQLLCQRWAPVLGREHVFRWAPDEDAAATVGAGTVVWSWLPRLSVLANELDHAEAALIWGRAAEASVSESSRPVLVAKGPRILLDPGPRLAEAGPDEPLLCVHRRADYLVRAVQAELFLRLDPPDTDTLYEAMTSAAVRRYPSLSRMTLARDLADRERDLPTALGHGVAVPQAYCDALSTRVCLVAVLERGLDMQAPDGEPVRLVFLLLSPKGDPEGHLATLSEIARLGGDARMRRLLLAAKDGAELVETLREALRS